MRSKRACAKSEKTKRRLVVVTGIIVIVLVVVLAVVGGSSSAKSVTIADMANGQYADQKVQVSGNVVENSFSTEDNVLTFDMYDPAGDQTQYLRVKYEGGVAATFGNDVTAICTGKVGADGVLHATELVTKCPSKYENSSNALGVAQLADYGDSVLDKPVKVTGTVKDGTLAAAGQGDRFVLVDAEGAPELSVLFDDALSDEVRDGSPLSHGVRIGAGQPASRLDVAGNARGRNALERAAAGAAACAGQVGAAHRQHERIARRQVGHLGADLRRNVPEQRYQVRQQAQQHAYVQRLEALGGGSPRRRLVGHGRSLHILDDDASHDSTPLLASPARPAPRPASADVRPVHQTV